MHLYVYLHVPLCTNIYLQQEPSTACCHQFKLIFLGHGFKITETIMNRGMFTLKPVVNIALEELDTELIFMPMKSLTFYSCLEMFLLILIMVTGFHSADFF